jgi:CelD/BcsL family acetyltransferase involved in cellulose biosynthesis
VIVTARDDGDLVGLLPLYVLEDEGRRKLLPIGVSLSDYCDALVEPRHRAVCASLLAAPRDVSWNECHLPELAPDATLLDAAPPQGCREARTAGAACPVLRLPSAVTALHDAVPKKALRNLHQARQRASRVGDVTIERADVTTLRRCMHDLFALHERRWRHDGFVGVCADASIQALHLAAAPALLALGVLRLHVMCIDRRAIAAYHGFVANGIAYAYLGGFDPAYAHVSPGAQMIGHAIEDAVRSGARIFDFLRGRESYKYAWGAVDRMNTVRSFTR